MADTASVKPGEMDYKDLMSSIESGVLKIPDFQRGFDWGLDRTLRLLDSIAKRYPVGSFLVWETTDRLGALRNIGNLALPDVPDGKDVRYVLDGQQRITSLFAAAKGLEIGGVSYAAYVDLDANSSTEPLLRHDCPDANRCIALGEVIGEYPNLVAPRLTPERQARFHQVREAFREYRFPCIIVKNQPIEAVCEMFERVNTGGMVLELFDIMVAKTWTEEFNLRDAWDTFAQTLKGQGYDRLPPRVMLQALAAHVGDGVSEKEIMRIGRDTVRPAWDQMTECVRRAVDFLRASAHVPGGRLLSYPSVLVVLAVFFDEHAKKPPNKEQTRRLCEYVWRVGLTERYGASPSRAVVEDLGLVRRIAAQEEGEVPVRLPVIARGVEGMPLRTGSALCRALLTVLASCRPVSIANGSEVVLDHRYLARANSKHYHHIFPRKWLEKQGHRESEANSLANIMFVPADLNLSIAAQAPSRYMAKYAKHAGDAWRAWLRGHLISAQAWDALQADDYPAFLAARSKTIADRANKLMGLSADQVKEMLGAS